jgi:2,4-dienoyl-CoA reductase-like NADH-dependent reductase (Old Yellow Enzyme family)/thioredoxin reductase
VNNKYDALFERTYIGKHGVKNRLVMAPMGAGAEMTGAIDDKGLDYYEARAKGGTGMLIIGFQLVTNKTDPNLRSMYAVDTTLQAYGWARLAERVKAHGASLCLQLSCGLGRNAHVVPGAECVSASVNPCYADTNQNTRALSIDEIHAIVAGFGRAAKRAKGAGADLIEIHAHLGYLLDQFMTPLWNRREDEYGGNFENRMRFTTEVYHAVRNVVGPDFPILFRMVLDHKIPGGRGMEESFEIVRYMDQLGIDAFDVDLGCYEAYDWAFPTAYLGDGCMADEVSTIKTVTRKPILSVGNYTPEAAVKAAHEGKTDFIVIGRGLLADPEYGNKLFENRREDIRPCIRCNEYCLTRASQRPLSCSVNAACCAEAEFEIKPVKSARNVAVVGGGPAGMEAARVAALKGHRVTLFEKDARLGGQLLAASAPAFKGQIKALMEYQKTQLKKLNVDIRVNTLVGADTPELAEADKIIIAAGANPIMPPIPGADRSNVLEVIAAHKGDQSRIGKTVVITGGGASGCDCAVELAAEGKRVAIVEMMDRVAPKANVPDKISIHNKFKELGIEVHTGHRVLAFTGKGVEVESEKGKTVLEADTMIMAFGSRPNSAVAKEIMDKYTTAMSIGDCVSIGQIGEAVRGGFFAGWSID